MKFRDRLGDRREVELRNPSPSDSSTGPSSGDLNNLREAGEALLDAADDAIDRGLSRNSEAFLAAGRQQGGE
jgi:hypothetical protein